MKTRIISAAVMIILVVAVLWAGSVYPPVLFAFMAFLAATAVYEMLYRTGVCRTVPVVAVAVLYSVLVTFSYGGYTAKIWCGLDPDFFTVLFVVAVAALSLRFHGEMNLGAIAAATGMPVLLSYAFHCVANLYLRENGLFFLFLLLNFSSVCDCGAYFTGVAFGKHKLCPGISPKKTIEGAVGGIIWSLVVSLILYFTMRHATGFVTLLLFTVPFCFVGMCGDLFASVIKRSVGIKDYGTLIPGHGGILDRFDSILLIAPVLLLCVDRGLIA